MPGHIVRRSPTSSWTVVIDLEPDPQTGHRRQLSRAVRGPKRDAEHLLIELLSQRDRGVNVRTDRLTVGQYLTDWLSGLAVRVRPTTATRYRGLMTLHVIPQLGGIRLRRLSVNQVNALLADRLAAGSAPRTVSHIRAVLRKALNDAVRADLLWRNVAALASAPLVPSRRLDPMSQDEALAILAATVSTPNGAVVATALCTGLRQGEILGLRWVDIDLDRGRLRVAGALQHFGGRFHLVEPKSASSRRTIPVPPPLVPILRSHRAAQAKAQLVAGSAWEELIPGLVFTTTLGRPLHGVSVTQEFQLACARAQLPRRRFHDLRHGTATLLLAAGVDLKTISTLLGHSTITLTANTYAGVVPALTADAMDRLGALLTPVSLDAL
jgi:integrase